MLASFILLSCNMKTYSLLDKITDVPINTNVYKNKSKFSASLLKTIDTGVVYEEYDRSKNILMSLDKCTACRGYRIFRFYSNGCLNMFFFDRNSTLPVNEFDPLYAGYRGVYYSEDNKIRFDLFAEIDQRQHTGKLSATLTFSGDTMYLKRDDLSYTEIYIKRKLPPEYFIYQANW